MKINLLGSDVYGRSIAATAQDRVNFYLDIAPTGGDKARVIAYPTPGLSPWWSGHFGYSVRGMIPMFQGVDSLGIVGDLSDGVGGWKTDLAVIQGSPATINYYTLATPASHSNDPVVMSTWGNQVVVAMGTSTFYCYHADTHAVDSGTLAFLSDAIDWVVFLNGRFIINGNQTSNPGQFFWSNLYDASLATGWNALQYATAESAPDKVVRGIAYRGILVLFGERTTEFWQPSGDMNQPYQPIGGTVGNFGLAANDRHSVQISGDTLIFCATLPFGGRSVCVLDGYGAKTVSPPDLDYRLTTLHQEEKSRGVVFRSSGHDFYLLNLETATYFYDLTSGTWGKWVSPGLDTCQIVASSSYAGSDSSASTTASLTWYGGLNWKVPGVSEVTGFSSVTLNGSSPTGWTSSPTSAIVTIPESNFTVQCTTRKDYDTTVSLSLSTGFAYTIPGSDPMVSVTAVRVQGVGAWFSFGGRTITILGISNTITCDFTTDTIPYTVSQTGIHCTPLGGWDYGIDSGGMNVVSLDAVYIDGVACVVGSVDLLTHSFVIAGLGGASVEADTRQSNINTNVSCAYVSGSSWQPSEAFDSVSNVTCNGVAASSTTFPATQTIGLVPVPGTVTATYTPTGGTVKAPRAWAGTVHGSVCEILPSVYMEPDANGDMTQMDRTIIMPHLFDADHFNKVLVSKLRVEADGWEPSIIVVGAADITEDGDVVDSAGTAGFTVTWDAAHIGLSTSLSGDLLTATGSSNGYAWATHGWSSGKHKFEVTIDVGDVFLSSFGVGLSYGHIDANGVGYSGVDPQQWGYRVRAVPAGYHAKQTSNASDTGYGANPAGAGTHVFGCYVDSDNGTIEFEMNGTKYGTAYTGLSGTVYPVFHQQSGGFTATLNAGATAFAYNPPSGWKSWDERSTY